MNKTGCHKSEAVKEKSFALASFVNITAKCFLFCLSVGAFCLASCSIPNLDSPECGAARQTVKDFYSFHFGNDMKPSKENLQPLGKFLTAELKQRLESQSEEAKDYFTATDDYPKAFRPGKCRVSEPNKKVFFQVLLFWKDENRTEQREVEVEVVNENDHWLISNVSQK